MKERFVLNHSVSIRASNNEKTTPIMYNMRESHVSRVSITRGGSRTPFSLEKKGLAGKDLAPNNPIL